MRIDGTDSLSYVAKLYAKNREVRREKALDGPGVKDGLSETSERAQISEEARLLSLAREAFDRLPDVRKDKVERLKERIESGEYRIDSKKLAQELLKYLGSTGEADGD
ncbi:MAG: flagellar biosynthesis anti-sigma factor FlgM [Bacillota bacterium]|nr:flagellar biosynthesis anti-sigma factor FlgM [Bacillota bacterium]HOB91499.1 flagellar biosynthesis anti-sigma factor FlgM [Bacillota bacterium]HPZ54653.1 flagellar biosynthesis anti-sigma factor FlgM [Bacillota bacterium]HQD18911.1 flagellar biosynthesis anti-sigma factor FlgM [Bacillota bacterium]